MKYYSLKTEFTFGRYNGITVEQIVSMGFKDYLFWCMLNLDHFIMSDYDINLVNTIQPDPEFPSDSICKNELKRSQFKNERELQSLTRDDMSSYFNNYNDNLDTDEQGPEFWNQF